MFTQQEEKIGIRIVPSPKYDDTHTDGHHNFETANYSEKSEVAINAFFSFLLEDGLHSGMYLL